MTDNRTDRTQKKDEPRKWWRLFLDSLSRTGNVLLSCKAAHIGRRTVYNCRERSEKFARLWDEAIEASNDVLEAEARRRGAQGIDRPIYFQGRRIDVVKEYSDTLLIFLLKANRPEKFRDNYDLKKLVDEYLVRNNYGGGAPPEKPGPGGAPDS